MLPHNFVHLQPHWPELATLASHAERYTFTDPQSALIKLRCFAEQLVGIVYREFRLPCQGSDKFVERLQSAAFTAAVDSRILEKLHAIRKVGNKAVHEGKVGKNDSLWLLKEAHILSYWLLIATNRGHKDDVKAFVQPQPSHAESAQSAAKHQAQLEQAIAELEALKATEQRIAQENAKLKQQIDEQDHARFKQASAMAHNSLSLDEAQTRQYLIDSELYAAGWKIDRQGGDSSEVSREYRVDGQPTATGVGYCDYVLWDDNGQPLAVIEAKRTRESADKGRQQAVLYADALERQFGQRPLVFYTNGYDIYICDDAQRYAPRKLYGYYSKASLQYLLLQRRQRQALETTPIDANIVDRDYQIEAISQVCEKFRRKGRKALVVQATGTGKTRVAIALSKRLLAAGWAQRILFLCDRRALRDQAAQAYRKLLHEPVHEVGESAKADLPHARIYIATYPAMMNLLEKFDVGFFDLIIADESHRSIYNVYGDVFKYFDALQLGLTATPIDMVSRSTCQLFGCEDKRPTAHYPLEKAIADQNLVPFKVVSHTTQFLRDGISAHALSAEQVAQLEDDGIDPNGLDFDSSAIDKQVFNKDTNRAILRNLMEHGLRLADGQTLGKSMIFARNIDHAQLLQQLFYDMYPAYGGDFCRVIHSKIDRAEQLIDNFKASAEHHAQKITIAISVDMLDTGIDVPEVLNLVFAKPVRSPVKFWQMIGRGTRLSPDLFGTGQPKTKFLIFDHWANFDYFSVEREDEAPSQAKSISQKLFEARLAFAKQAQKLAKFEQFNTMIALIKQDIDALDDGCIAVRDEWKVKQQFGDMAVLQQFAPSTYQTLHDKIAPLMQWRNIRGQREALQWDLDLLLAQYALLTASKVGMQQGSQQVVSKVGRLSMHLNQVRQKADCVRQLQSQDFWQQATLEQLEHARLDLRSVIHLCEPETVHPAAPPVILDIAENPDLIEIAAVSTNICTVDYEIYRQDVERVLTPLFEHNPILQKIRAGIAVTEAEIEQLNVLIHTQNDQIDLRLLQQFYPDSSVSIGQLLRTIVGLDAKQIDAQFQQFIVENHIHLNTLQQRFLSLLKAELCRTGKITIARLYQQPFQSLHQDGIDGLFQEQQSDLLIEFVQQYVVNVDAPAQQVQTVVTGENL